MSKHLAGGTLQLQGQRYPEARDRGLNRVQVLAKQLHRLPQHTIFGLYSSTQSGQGRRHGRQFGYGVKEAALTGTCGMLSLYSLLSLMCVSSAAVLGIVLALARAVREILFGVFALSFCFLDHLNLKNN